MTAIKQFEEFGESKYAEEASQRWGKTREFAESQKKWSGYSEEQKEAIKSEGDRLITHVVGEDPNTLPVDPGVQAAVGEYLLYVNNNFYVCNVAALRGLTGLWLEDPGFANKFEAIRKGGGEFFRQAVQLHCDSNG